MGFAANSFATLADAFSRGMTGKLRASAPTDGLDPYERAPLRREDVADLYEMRTGTPLDTAERLRESERHEHQTLMSIRTALYATD